MKICGYFVMIQMNLFERMTVVIWVCCLTLEKVLYRCYKLWDGIGRKIRYQVITTSVITTTTTTTAIFTYHISHIYTHTYTTLLLLAFLPLLQDMINTFHSSQESQRNYRMMDGVLVAVGTLAKIMYESKTYKSLLGKCVYVCVGAVVVVVVCVCVQVQLQLQLLYYQYSYLFYYCYHYYYHYYYYYYYHYYYYYYKRTIREKQCIAII